MKWMRTHIEDNNEEFGEAAGVCSTCAGVMADIYKDAYSREIAKIDFESSDDDNVLTSADRERVWLASDRARLVAIIGLEGYQEGMRQIADQAVSV
jgi:hypothetical protein